MPRSKVTMAYFPQIRDWISNFLDNNKDMTASLIGHNLLGRSPIDYYVVESKFNNISDSLDSQIHWICKYGYDSLDMQIYP